MLQVFDNPTPTVGLSFFDNLAAAAETNATLKSLNGDAATVATDGGSFFGSFVAQESRVEPGVCVQSPVDTVAPVGTHPVQMDEVKATCSAPAHVSLHVSPMEKEHEVHTVSKFFAEDQMTSDNVDAAQGPFLKV